MTSAQTSPMSYTDAKRSLGLPNIAFVGKAGAGKTTAANLLHELGYSKLSFATPLKSIALDIWGGDSEDREKLQRLGVAVREIDEAAWVNLLLVKLPYYAGPVAVDDCRFPNEWFALKAEGFVIVRVDATYHLRVDRLKANGKWQDETQLTHESEMALDNYEADYNLLNESSAGDLYDDLVEIVLKERKRR